MIRRLFAFVILLGVAAAGLWYWSREHGRTPPELEAVGEAVGRRLDDARLHAAVKAAFELNRRLAPLPVRLEAEDGVVTLRGDVPDAGTRALAEQVAGAVPGVRQVVGHLRVAPAAAAPRDPASERTLGESVDDHALSVKVRLAISLRRDLREARVDVRTFRREVTLSGEVPGEAQRASLVALVRDIPDVVAVVDRLRVTGAVVGGPRAAVERALRGSEHLAHYAIEVREEHGRVVLRGRVGSGAEKELAGRVAREAAGAPVDNALEVGPGGA
jgi:osmotically-inducible protein OsmY